MNLLLIKQVGSTFNVTSDKVNIEVVTFDNEKYKGNLDAFVSDLSSFKFDGIIVQDSLDESLNYLGLELCVRIRLSQERLSDRIYSTFFIFSSKDSQEIFKSQVLHKANTTASIFFTRGVFLFDDIDFVKILIENSSSYNLLDANNFHDQFLDVIQIKKNPHLGNHSIANLWGVTRLAEVTGNKNLLDKYFESNPKITENQSDLYFKFLISQSSFNGIINSSKKTISATGKNILLIDDEESKGWAVILKELLQGSNFESVLNNDNFKSTVTAKISEKINGISKWDLILLDLRLYENEDKGDESLKSASQFSGGKLLTEIKNDNKGVQVIMFTASNKAWNMRELQELGADGFYIKESPEYSKDHTFSIGNYKNFEKQISHCFSRNLLKNIYFTSQKIKDKFNKNPLVKYFPSGLSQLRGIQYQNLLLNELDTIYEIVSSSNDNRFNHSLLMQFKILECLAEIFVIEKNGSDWKFWDGSIMKFYYSDNMSLLNRTDEVPVYKHETGKKVNERIPKYWYESTGNKIHTLMSQKLGLPLNSPVHKEIDNLIGYRNKFIHPRDRMSLSSLKIEDINVWMNSVLYIVESL